MDSKTSNINNLTWLTVPEAAAHLRISISLLRKLIARKQVPFRRLPGAAAGKIIFNRKMLDYWILLNGKQNVTQRERQALGAFI